MNKLGLCFTTLTLVACEPTPSDDASATPTDAAAAQDPASVPARPTDAQLHAYKVVHHARYMVVTAEQAGGTNKLLHTTELPTEGADPVVTPALDHLYSKAVIDLTGGPVTLDIPKVTDERYYSIHITDQEHYTIYDEMRPAGEYVFVRKGSEAKVPEGATIIECPGDYPHLFIRVQIKTPEDRDSVLAVQSKIQLRGESKPLVIDDAIAFTLATHDVYPQNEGLLASVPDYSDTDHEKVFDFVGLRALTIKNNMGAFGPIDSTEPGSNDPEIRAAAIIGHLGLPAQHALYTPVFTNCEGAVLSGDAAEVFVLPYEPPGVKEFWSVTRYSALTRNTLPGKNDIFNAYNTEPDAEGNITVTFAAEDPGDGSYWMAVNAGEPYYFVVRHYGPDLSAPPSHVCSNP